MCECTNAQNPGFSMSEKYIIDELRRIIKRCPGRIFLTTFASNLERIEELIEIAVKAGRKIVIGGRSMDNNISVSIKSGFLNIGKE
jgi:ribonuclease J